MGNDLTSLTKWPANLPLEIAHHEASLGTPLYSLEEICDHFGITADDFDRFKDMPAFRAEVRGYIAEIKDTNSIIRRKVRKQAELYFDKLVPRWLADDNFPAPEKVKLLTLLAKTARVIDDPAEKVKLEAEQTKNLPQAQPTLNLYLTTAPDQQPVVIDATVERVPDGRTQDNE